MVTLICKNKIPIGHKHIKNSNPCTRWNFSDIYITDKTDKQQRQHLGVLGKLVQQKYAAC